MLDEALATLAMEHANSILKRNNRIIRENHETIDRWIREEPLIDWVPPRAGSVGFMQQKVGVPASKLCLGLMEEESTFLVPGDCFEHPEHIRIGYGNPKGTITEGLKRLSRFLERFR
jgi:aspartate/methionine/tyrosine aminotransferase